MQVGRCFPYYIGGEKIMQTSMTMNQQMMNPALYNNLNLKNNSTLNEWLLLYLKSIKDKVTVNTYNNYNSYINKHILPELGNKKLMELTTPLLNDFVSKKLKYGRIRVRGENHGLSVKTVKEFITLLKKALDKAVQEGEMLFNPCHSVYIPSQIKPEVQALEQEDQSILESHITNTFMSNSLLMVKVALHAGLRNGEVCALKVKDIDLEKGLIDVDKTLYRTRTETGKTEIVISKTKNKRQRFVPMSDELKHDLQVYVDTMPDDMKDNPEQFLFVNKRGKPLEPRRLLYHFKKLLKEAGLKNIKFHNLRHTFATRCLECGIELKIVSKILGHSTIQITADLYTHVTKRAMQKAMTKFNKENWMNAYKNI